MRTANEMYNYCLDNDFCKGFANKRTQTLKNFSIIEKNMMLNEHAIICFTGKHASPSIPYTGLRFACVVTNTRIMLAQKQVLEEIFLSMSFDFINDIRFFSNPLSGVIIIDTINESLKIGITGKESAFKINNSIIEILHNFKDSKNNHDGDLNKNNNTSINDIRELKKLLDDGIITQEEFDLKKKQLLNL